MNKVKSDKVIWYIFLLVISILFALEISSMKISDKKVIYANNVDANQAIGGIYQGNILQQVVKCKYDTFAGFGVGFATYGRTNHCLVKVSLLNDNYTELYKWEFGAEILEDNTYTTFMFPEIEKEAEGKSYIIRIESNASREDDNNITIYSTLNQEKITDEYLYQNGPLPEGTLAIRTIIKSYNTKTFISIVVLILTCIFILSMYIGVSKLKLEKKYIILASIIGLVYLVLLPFGIGADESKHWLRIYEVSEGHMLSDRGIDGGGGRKMDSGLIPIETSESFYSVSKFWNASINSSSKHFYTFSNTALYSPVSYAVQALTVAVGKIFTNRIVFLTYMAKISGFLFSLIMIYMSIKYIPVKKDAIILISFMPMFIQQSVVITADGFINAVAVAFTAYVLYLKYTYEDVITRKQILVLLAFMLIIGLCKVVFLPICFLIFILPQEKFKNKNLFFKTTISLFLLSCFMNITWLMISSSYLGEIREGVNGGQQVMGILSNPLGYLKIMYNTIISNGEMILWQFFGDGLGALSIPIKRFPYYIYAEMMLIAALADSEKKIDIKTRIVALIAFTGTIILIFTAEYVQWTRVGAEIIDGIQGRYFIPIALIGMIILSKTRLKLEKDECEKYIFPFLAYVNSFVIMNILNQTIR